MYCLATSSRLLAIAAGRSPTCFGGFALLLRVALSCRSEERRVVPHGRTSRIDLSIAEPWVCREVEHINPFLRSLERKPVIAGIKHVKDATAAIAAGVEIIFLLTGTIFDISNLVTEHGGGDVLIFAHVDLLQGVGRDPQGMRFLAKEIGIDGMLSTRSNLIRAAKDEGLYTVQRFFLLDSEALKTAVNVLTKSKPDAVEILPALVLPNIEHRLPISQLPPVIAGGLVETEEELRAVLRTPIKAVSTSRPALWSARR